MEEVGTDARTSVREHARGFNVQLIKADHTFRKLFDFFFEFVTFLTHMHMHEDTHTYTHTHTHTQRYHKH